MKSRLARLIRFALFASCFVFKTSPLLCGEVVDRVVATVGNEIITLSDVKHYQKPKSNKKVDPMDSGDPLEALIREKLLKLEMNRLEITATDEDISGSIHDVLTRNKITLDTLKAEIARKGISFESYKKDMAEEIKQMKFMGQVIFPRIKVTDEEISRKAAGNSTDEGRFRARLALLQERAPEELRKYLDEAKAKTYIDIKK